MKMNLRSQLLPILIMGCAFWLTGCSSLSVVAYPEPQELPDAKRMVVKATLAEHGPKTEWELIKGIDFRKDDLYVTVRAESERETPMFIGPPYVPIIPAFWLDWFFGPFGDKKLKITINFGGSVSDADPRQFVIVQNGKEMKPTEVSGSVREFKLEYDTSNWEFTLKLRGVRNASGIVELPDVNFSRGSVWVFGLAP
jgi:hypothetical protein